MDASVKVVRYDVHHIRVISTAPVCGMEAGVVRMPVDLIAWYCVAQD
jgi:hypothetical protein